MSSEVLLHLVISLSEVQSTFNFSVSYIDCETRAMCGVFRALNVSNCSVRYGEDSSYQDFSGTISPQVNESFSIMELEEETIYYFEVTFTVSNEIDHIYRLQRSYQSGTYIRTYMHVYVHSICMCFQALHSYRRFPETHTYVHACIPTYLHTYVRILHVLRGLHSSQLLK